MTSFPAGILVGAIASFSSMIADPQGLIDAALDRNAAVVAAADRPVPRTAAEIPHPSQAQNIVLDFAKCLVYFLQSMDQDVQWSSAGDGLPLAAERARRFRSTFMPRHASALHSE